MTDRRFKRGDRVVVEFQGIVKNYCHEGDGLRIAISNPLFPRAPKWWAVVPEWSAIDPVGAAAKVNTEGVECVNCDDPECSDNQVMGNDPRKVVIRLTDQEAEDLYQYLENPTSPKWWHTPLAPLHAPLSNYRKYESEL